MDAAQFAGLAAVHGKQELKVEAGGAPGAGVQVDYAGQAVVDEGRAGLAGEGVGGQQVALLAGQAGDGGRKGGDDAVQAIRDSRGAVQADVCSGGGNHQV